MFSPGQIKALFITPMIGGTVSIVSSGTLLFMILRSELKLSMPRRRILFGLCLYDCIFSLSVALSSIPVPKAEGIWGASGNIATCNFQGFLMHIGMVGANFYNCSLSIYYSCIIRLSMTEAAFTKKVEPFCHLIPNLYGFGGAFYLLINEYFNSIGNSCWVGPSPINCIIDSEVECLRGGTDAYTKRWWFFGYSIYLVWAVIIVAMTSIVYVVVKQRRTADRWATGSTLQNQNLWQSFLRKSQRLFAGPAHDDSSQKIAENFVNTTPKTLVSNLREPSRSSFRVKKGQEDPLAFNLRDMRARTRRKSLILKEEPASIDGVVRSLQSDPHPFDVKTARYSFTKAESVKKKNRSQHSIRPPPLLDLEKELRCPDSEMVCSNENETTSETRKLRSNKRRSSVTIDNSTVSDRRKSMSFGDEDAPPATTTRGHSLGNSQRVVAIQALLYITSFFLCFVWSVALRILEQQGKPIPYPLYFTARLMLPLQGLFNIILYTRPFVLSLRQSHPEYSRWKAFCITVANAGDNQSKRCSNVSQKVRDRIEQNNRERLQSIRQTRRGSLFNSVTSSTPRLGESHRLSIGSSLPHESSETGLLNIERGQDDPCVTKSAEPNISVSLSWDKDYLEKDSITRNDDNDVAGAADPKTSEYTNIVTAYIQVDDSSRSCQGVVSKSTEDRAPELPVSSNDETVNDNNDVAQRTDVKSSAPIEISNADDKEGIDEEMQ